MYTPNPNKTSEITSLIGEAVFILDAVGIPLKDKTARAVERLGMALLAVAGVTGDWSAAQGVRQKRYLTTRQIIEFHNHNLEENISSGSYDDIRRKDLLELTLADIVLKSAGNEGASTNDPTRGYALEDTFRELLVTFNTSEWEGKLREFLSGRTTLREAFARKRELEKISIVLPSGTSLKFSPGGHNELQKAICEQFLPLFGYGCKVLYIGDTTNRHTIKDTATLNSLNFFELAHEELPDIIAYNAERNWLYLIEAVYTGGPISEQRLMILEKLTSSCSARIIYVTAFLDKAKFKEFAGQIAWETEVWIAENPEHLIHFNGDKFLGPYKV